MALNPMQQQALLGLGAGLLGSAPTAGDRLSRGLLGAQQGMGVGQQMMQFQQQQEARQRRQTLADQILANNRKDVPGTTQYAPAAPQGIPHMGAQYQTQQGNVPIGSGVTGSMTTQGAPTTQGLLAAEAIRGGDYKGAYGMLAQGGANIGNIDPGKYTPESIAMFKRTGDYSVLDPISATGAGKVQPGDYTPESFAEYMRTGDYSVLKRFNPWEQKGSPEWMKQQERQRKLEKQKEKEAEEEQFANEALDLSIALLTPEEEGGHREGLTAAAGPVAQWTPTMREGTATAEQRLQRLKSLLTKENLGLMSGVLSESDIKILEGIGASLELGQGDESMLQEVGRISAKLAIANNRIGDLTVDGIKAIAQNDTLMDSLTEEQAARLNERMDELGMN